MIIEKPQLLSINFIGREERMELSEKHFPEFNRKKMVDLIMDAVHPRELVKNI